MTVDAIIEALGAFITPFVNGYPIVRGQGNRVPPPVTGFVVLTEMRVIGLETPTTVKGTITRPTQFDVQMDFYGPFSGDQCIAVSLVFRSEYAPAQFPDGLKPLYCSDGMQAPLVTGEHQYEQRWTLTASLQYNPSITVPYQSATSLAVTVYQES